MTTQIVPLHDRVVVKRSDEEATTPGGIILTDSAKEKPSKGTVIAVGNGKRTEDGKTVPVDVKVGDLVLFGQYSGSAVKIDGEEYLIMSENEIFGILRS